MLLPVKLFIDVFHSVGHIYLYSLSKSNWNPSIVKCNIQFTEGATVFDQG